MVWTGWALVRASGRVFLEAAPAGVDPGVVGARLVTLPGVAQLHDLHVWDLGAGTAAMSAHVLVDAGLGCHEVAGAVRAVLAAEFGITHATLQAEHVDRPQSDGECLDAHGPVHVAEQS